ncbi:MAG: DUF6691 family protein [Pseudomonadota bacterium]
MKALVALGVGLLFSAGLLTSGMTDTTIVQGFLDVLGAWDPTLAFVIAGALVPMFVAWALTRPMGNPVLGNYFPDRRRLPVTLRLVVGSAMFGIGWGLSGFCPGPNMASLSFGGWSALAFFIAMAAGMIVYPYVQRIMPS